MQIHSNVKVSVVMPVYNAENYLKESIESILRQSYKNFELIIINDGSTDNSLNIVNEYEKKDNRISVVSRENKGLVKTLNEAMSISNGKYIMRMDADDVAAINRIEKQLSVFEIDPACSIVGCFVEVIDENGLKIEDDPRPSSEYGVRLFEGYGCAIGSPTMMFSRELTKKIGGFSEESWPAEDYEWQTRVLKLDDSKLTIIPEQLYKYRINNQGISQQNHRLQALATIKYGNLARKTLLGNGWAYCSYKGHKQWLEDAKQWANPVARKRMMDIYYTAQLWFRQDDKRLHATITAVLLFIYTLLSNPKDVSLFFNRPEGHFVPNE